MPRLMSVALTEDAVRERTKTVTRRLGWLMLKPGDQLTLCRKVMGRKKGEPLVRITDVEVVSVRREPLSFIRHDDGEVAREGFLGWTGHMFEEFFCEHMGCKPSSEVTRIEWRYLDDGCVCCGTTYDLMWIKGDHELAVETICRPCKFGACERCG